MYVYYNPNPVGRESVGDCSVRAISKALDISWEDAYAKLAVNAFRMGDMPSSNSVISSVLRMNGFYRENLPCIHNDRYSVRDFARNNPRGVYVLGTGTHVVTVIDGDWFDSWNSGDEIPQYFWTR